MGQGLCPVCDSVTSTALEAIDLVTQHESYAPRDRARQQLLGKAAQAIAPRYLMRRCAHCGLEWADPMQAPSEEWYRLAYSSLDLYPQARWEFDYVLKCAGTGDVILDVGCGTGAFLRRCAAAGITARGADFSAQSVGSCRAAGLDVEQIDLDASSGIEETPRASVVTAFQVLEHLSRPQKLLELAHASSLPSAILWVAVPSDSRPSRAFGERDFLDQPPHHLTRWSRAALAVAGARCGWRLDSLFFEPLSLSAALWSITVRSGFYRRTATEGLRRSLPNAERALRLLHAPAALALRTTRFRAMSGFSMLARFSKGAMSASGAVRRERRWPALRVATETTSLHE
jgi:SAM-dependent methyltransferase